LLVDNGSFNGEEMIFISIRRRSRREDRCWLCPACKARMKTGSLLIRLICIKARLEWRNDQSSRCGKRVTIAVFFSKW